MTTPIALFAYNRPDHLDLVLTSLARCDRLDECRLYIYCDGPKRPEQAEAVAVVRNVARKWAERLHAEVIEREENMGLARSIVTGVGDLCDRYGRVIVIEDDFVLAPDFLDYMIQALDRYADDVDVYQISGHMFHVAHPEKPDCFFLPLTTTWGWATWKRAWIMFDWYMTGAVDRLADPKVLEQFDLGGAYPYARMARSAVEGRVDSWGIRWWWSVFNAGGISLFPRRSLVWVGGFDGSGTHCEEGTAYRQETLEMFSRPQLGHPIAWPERVTADRAAFRRITRHFRWERVVRRVQRLVIRLWKRGLRLFGISR